MQITVLLRIIHSLYVYHYTAQNLLFYFVDYILNIDLNILKKKKIIDKYTGVLLSSSIKLVLTAVNDSSACISL